MINVELDFQGLSERARTLVDDGREAELTGRHDEARRCFEEALRYLDPTATGQATTLVRWIAWTHAQSGDPEAALECLEVATLLAESGGDIHALATTLNTRAGTLFNLGELDEAEELFRRVLAHARNLGDVKLVAMANQNLGSVSCIRGDLDVALKRFQASLKGYESLGLTKYVGPLLNNIGRLQTDLGQNHEAGATLARSRELCIGGGDKHHRIMVEINWARLMLQLEQPTAALFAGEAARRLAAESGDDRWMSEIDLVIGGAHGRSSNPERALEFLQRAADVARERKEAKVQADVALEQAAVFRDLGKNPETLQRLNEAHRIFRHLRARRELADVDSRIANLEAVFLEIVRNWGQSIESKDAYTHGHCSRVSEIACRLAAEAGLPEEEMTWFRMGALLHDVGKVSVPLSILNKPGPLDAEEMAVMARHPVTGIELLKDVDFPWDVRPMIRHHHERWNGKGYPDQIAGEAIPRSARILTVADVYDALTTDRAYRKGFSHADAMGIMESESGQTLDPLLFRLFEERVATNDGALSAPATQAPVFARSG